jgi:hypothetical protein
VLRALSLLFPLLVAVLLVRYARTVDGRAVASALAGSGG